MATDTSSLPLQLIVICIILATGDKTPEAAESFHSGPVQDEEYRHHHHYVCVAMVSDERSGSVTCCTEVGDGFS